MKWPIKNSKSKPSSKINSKIRAHWTKCMKASNTKCKVNFKMWFRIRMGKSWRWSNRFRTPSSSPRNRWRWSTPSRWKTTNTKKKLRTFENRWSNYNSWLSKIRNRRPSRMTRQFNPSKKNREAVWGIVSRMECSPRKWAPILGKFWRATKMLARVAEGIRETGMNQRKVKLGIILWLKVSTSTPKIRNPFKLLHSNPNNIRFTNSTVSQNKLSKRKSRCSRGMPKGLHRLRKL